MKRIPITYNKSYFSRVLLGLMWINRSDTPEQILERANRIFLSQYPDDKPRKLLSIRPGSCMASMYWTNPIENAQLFQRSRTASAGAPNTSWTRTDSTGTIRPNHYDETDKLTYLSIGFDE